MEEERMKKKKKAATPCLTISGFQEDDAQALARWAGGDGRVLRQYLHAFEELPGAGLHASRPHVAQELVPLPCSLLAVRLEGGGDPVGAVSVTRYSCGAARGLQRGELGFFVDPENWGRGIATTAVGAVVGYAFGRWSCLAQLDAVVEAENGAAQRVLEKNGFVKQGRSASTSSTPPGRDMELFVYGLRRASLDSHDEHPDII